MSQLSKAEHFFNGMIEPELVLQNRPPSRVANPDRTDSVQALSRTDQLLCGDFFPISLNKTKNGMARLSGAPSWKKMSLAVLSGPVQGRERKWETPKKKREKKIST
ncbi:MAG: hypothetical protein RBR34_02600 [Rhodospirillaceae bacterium]|nr:hypothetical protein [Rhodospirillaceae bacterium]